MPIAHVIVKGRVQGVFYRQSTKERATALGLCGWVRNLDNGNVELIASGSQDQLNLLIEWCKKGPPAAVVNSLDVTYPETADLTPDFRVR